MASKFRLTSPKVKLVENHVETAVIDVLRYRHHLPLRQHVGRFRTLDGKRVITAGELGLPDYAIPAFFVEVKRPGGELSDEQKWKIFELEKCWDLETAVVESADELVEWLKNREARKNSSKE